MESTFAKIENDVVVSVEVVTKEFMDVNPERYTGTWIEVGGDSGRIYCGKGYIYFPAKDKIVNPQPFPSWSLDASDTWQAPSAQPESDYYWDEDTLTWIQAT